MFCENVHFFGDSEINMYENRTKNVSAGCGDVMCDLNRKLNAEIFIVCNGSIVIFDFQDTRD